MEIRVLSGECVRVAVSKEECGAMGVSYEEFSPGSISSRLFVAGILARLGSLGVTVDRSQRLTAEVFPSGGGLVVFISGKGLVKAQSAGEQGRGEVREAEFFEEVTIFRTPDEVLAAAELISPQEKTSLYVSPDTPPRYALITESPVCGTPEENAAPIRAAKVKEHWKLLADDPIEKLKAIIR